MKNRVAIIGSGISGLACGYFLHKNFDVKLYDKNDHVGGHSLTATATEGENLIPIDMGFMVFNKVTYPNLTRLFDTLNVAYENSDMSFSVQHVPENIEYCGKSINHLFAQRVNLLKLRHWKMLLRINRFNKEAKDALITNDYNDLTLREYVEKRNYGRDFLNLYIIPMSSAIWSSPPHQMLNFPAITLLRFFDNHGFLGMKTQHQWLTPTGGSKEYVKILSSGFKDKISNSNEVSMIKNCNDGVEILFKNGESEYFDKVILACHAAQALNILKPIRNTNFDLLKHFKYQKNTGTLHTDASVMPTNQKCWASWNYRIKMGDNGKYIPRTTYWMNSLQNVSKKKNYFVSINGEDEIKKNTVVKQVNFEHPLFDSNSIKAQSKLKNLNTLSNMQNIFLCGSYFKYGFHEDALNSAINVSEILLKKSVWN